MVKIKKYEVVLIAFWLIAINLHRFFDATGIRADIYLFYDYSGGRLMSNILYEIGMHLSRIIPSLILYLRLKKELFFILAVYLILDFIAYLLFFGQRTNTYIILILIVYIAIKWKSQKK